MKKSTKQLLSVGFHLLVLTGMVLTYDASKAMATKLGYLKSPDAVKSMVVDFRDQDHSGPGIEIDPELKKLVDVNEKGYAFRRDLPFPADLKVSVWDIHEFKKVRYAGKSPFGEGNATLSYRTDEVTEYHKVGGALRLTLKEKVMERTLSPAEVAAKVKLEEAAKEGGAPILENNDRVEDRMRGKVVDFKYNGQEWKSVRSPEFATMAWGKDLETEISKTFVENGLGPRPRWFGSKRLKAGDPMKLSGPTLNLVFDGVAGGSVDMVFTGIEGVHGHPCAVFDVSGNLQLSDVAGPTGETIKAQMTIESGKVWLSLLYPVLLRSELNTIQSAESREGGKLVMQLQGEVEIITIRDWEAITAAPADVSLK